MAQAKWLGQQLWHDNADVDEKQTLSKRGINVGNNERTMSLSSAASITFICILMAARLNGNSCVSMNGFRMPTHCSAGIARANVVAHSSAARFTYQYTHTHINHGQLFSTTNFAAQFAKFRGTIIAKYPTVLGQLALLY